MKITTVILIFLYCSIPVYGKTGNSNIIPPVPEDWYPEIHSEIREFENTSRILHKTNNPQQAIRIYRNRLRNLNDSIMKSFISRNTTLWTMKYLSREDNITALLLPVLLAIRKIPPFPELPDSSEEWSDLDIITGKLIYSLSSQKSASTISSIISNHSRKFESTFNSFSAPDWMRKMVLSGPLSIDADHVDPSYLDSDEVLIVIRGTPLPGTLERIAYAVKEKPVLILMNSSRIPDQNTVEILNSLDNFYIGLETPWILNASLEEKTMYDLIEKSILNLKSSGISPEYFGPVKSYRNGYRAATELGLIPVIKIPEISHNPCSALSDSIHSLKSTNIWVFEADLPVTPLLLEKCINQLERKYSTPESLNSLLIREDYSKVIPSSGPMQPFE